MAKNATIKNNNTVHPQGPDLGPTVYAPFNSRSEYTLAKPKNLLGGDSRPVSGMTLKPTNSGSRFNVDKAEESLNSRYTGLMNKGNNYANIRQTPYGGPGPVIK